MDQEELQKTLRLLKKSIKKSDWDLVVEAVEYIEDFVETDDEDESSY